MPAVLLPRGVIAAQELTLMMNVASLMAIIALAVFSLAFFFAWWYRAGNIHAKYLPNWEHGAMTELVWWAIPIEIVLILGALTWSSTHALDPHQAIAAEGAPLTVQVVALPWKWLFIYPEEGIASVNELHLPVGRPVEFSVTADAPMNSFWIPQLGGQIYAMTGMVTELNLMADTPGVYLGSSANYSGEGFANMRFNAVASSEEDFDRWVGSARASSKYLSLAEYEHVREPGEIDAPQQYSRVAKGLFDSIVMRFMPAMTEGMHAHAH